MYSISKEFTFSAGHRLRGLYEDHPCARQHGHNYSVRITLAGELNEIGFVYDYGDLRWFGAYLDHTLDHRNLNDVLEENPTAENLSRHLFDFAHRTLGDLLVEVSVSETPKTWASYSREVGA